MQWYTKPYRSIDKSSVNKVQFVYCQVLQYIYGDGSAV